MNFLIDAQLPPALAHMIITKDEDFKNMLLLATTVERPLCG